MANLSQPCKSNKPADIGMHIKETEEKTTEMLFKLTKIKPMSLKYQIHATKIILLTQKQAWYCFIGA